MAEKVGVIIVNYNNYQKTIETCLSLISYSYSFENLLIIDNGSKDDSFNRLNKYFSFSKNVIFLHNDNNLGYAQAVNLGIDYFSKLNFKYCLISNNDIIYNYNPFPTMLKNFEIFPNLAVVGPKVFNTKGKIQHSSRIYEPYFLELFGFFSNPKKLHEGKLKNPQVVYSVSGCSMMISIPIFVRLGLFDKNTFLYNEENIISYILSQNGFLTVFEPNISIIHAHGSTSGNHNMFVNKNFLISSVYYWYRYKKTHILFIYLLFFYLTLKWLLKSFFVKEMRSNWNLYFQDVISYIKRLRQY